MCPVVFLKFQFKSVAMISRLFAIFVVVQCVSTTIILDCTYFTNPDWEIVGNVYTCNARVIQTNQTRNVVGVSQNHSTGMTDDDVRMLEIIEQPIDFIPEDINLFFPNLEGIGFVNCPITSVSQDDLKPFPNLKLFEIAFGQLTTINGDIFLDSPELQLVSFGYNFITNVGPGLFQNSPKVIYAYLSGNLCIDNYAGSNASSVAALELELAFKCPPTVEMTEQIILQGENFQTAVNEQIEPEIDAIDGRISQLEEEISINHATALEKIQQLEEANRIANERIEALEMFIFNLCEVHAICS